MIVTMTLICMAKQLAMIIINMKTYKKDALQIAKHCSTRRYDFERLCLSAMASSDHKVKHAMHSTDSYTV